MNTKEIQERLDILNELFTTEEEKNVAKPSIYLYQQLIEQIKILKDIESWEPDPLGIDPYSQIAHHCRWAARDYLKKIGEL